MSERIPHEPSAAEREVSPNRTSAEAKVARAVEYADHIMSTVPETTAGRDFLWMVHFYSYFARGAMFENPALMETIRHFEDKAHAAAELAGTPWELREHSDEADEYAIG